MIRFCACGESCLRRHRPGRGTALRSAGGAHAHRRWLRRFTELAKEFGDVDKLAMLMTPPAGGTCRSHRRAVPALLPRFDGAP